MIHYLRYCCAMLFALFSFLLATPLSAQAQTREAYVSQSEDETTLTFYYDALRATRTGTTWGIGETVTIKNISYPAWAGNDEAHNSTTTQVVFDASFREFRPTTTAKWFYNCRALKQIKKLENLNIQNVTDMSWMLLDCSGLTALDVSSFDTKNVTNMLALFAGCSGLTALNVSNFNTQNVKDMNLMFAGCSGLTALDVSNFDTQNVTDMSWMFAGCSALTALNVSNFDTKNVRDMSRMFLDCKGLAALAVSNFDNQNVTDMCRMFAGCSSLTSLDVSHFGTQNVTNMNGMFLKCSGLTALDVSSFDTKNVKDMCRMFAGCSSLTALDISNFDTKNVKDMQELFAGCSGLTALDVSNFNTKNVVYMGEMFAGCSALTTIYSDTDWQCPLSYRMFAGCEKLKGAVDYDANQTEATMANSESGYFTHVPTSVERVGFGADSAQHIYTLQGKRVRGVWKHLPASVYIVNGKKTVKP